MRRILDYTSYYNFADKKCRFCGREIKEVTVVEGISEQTKEKIVYYKKTCGRWLCRLREKIWSKYELHQ
jgi:hypothetical protein